MPTTTIAAPSRKPTIPATMKTAAIDRFGPPEVLTPHVLPVPKVGPQEVLIALHAAGVGIWDAKVRDGTSATGRERFPLVLGTDGAGVIVARGARVRHFQVGDRVWAYEYSNPKGRIVAYDGEARLQYPLEQAAVAHARVKRGHVLGRIVLRTPEEG